MLDEDPAPLTGSPPAKEVAAPPQFSTHVYCSQTVGWIKMALGMEVGLGPGHIVLNGDPAPLPKRGRDQTAGWTKMPLGTEVGLGPGDIVLDVDPVPPPKKRAQRPIFGQCPLWPNDCIYQDITWYGGRPQHRLHCVRWRPSSPSSKGTQQRLLFSAHVYCGNGHGRLSQLLLSSCSLCNCVRNSSNSSLSAFWIRIYFSLLNLLVNGAIHCLHIDCIGVFH